MQQALKSDLNYVALESSFRVYAYGDDGVDDFGWGCSYRNIMTVLAASGRTVPSFNVLTDHIQHNKEDYRILEVLLSALLILIT